MPNQPPIFCNAKTRNGTPCRQIAGKRTAHPGSGKCWLHGGRSTGARTEEGKSTSAQNARKHGIYARVLTDRDLERLKAAQKFDAGEILKDNFYLIQSRTLGLIENETKFSKESKSLLQACAILVQNEQISEEFVDGELREILEGMSIQNLSRVFNSSANLATAANALDKAGAIAKQLSISKDFIIALLKNSNDPETKNMALECIEQLKLDAGLPIEEMDALLVQLEEEDTAEDEVGHKGATTEDVKND